MSMIEWANSNQGFLMVLLTAIYAVTTLAMFKSNSKMLRLSIQQKEQDRVIASLGLIKELFNICKDVPVNQKNAFSQKEKLSSLQGEISALGGVEAYLAYKKLYDLLNELYKTNDSNVFSDIRIKQEFSKRHLALESFFRSEAVAKQAISPEKRTMWQKITRKPKIARLPLPMLEMGFQLGWGADTSRYGVLSVPASKGQCAVTAMILQDYYKGDIYKIKVGDESHYFNIINNKVVDLTSDQFFQKIDYKDKIIVDRNDFEQETINRYLILKSRVAPFLLSIGVLKKAM